MATNTHFLVLCQDTATGFARVGWAAEHPRGRFTHLEVVSEAIACQPINRTSPYYQDYQTACQKARKINQALLSEQAQQNHALGWVPVPFDLCANQHTDADEFGSYQSAAMLCMCELTNNHLEVWAVITKGDIIHIESRQAGERYKGLEYQVWKHHTLSQLGDFSGHIVEGCLAVQESGLWFRPDHNKE